MQAFSESGWGLRGLMLATAMVVFASPGSAWAELRGGVGIGADCFNVVDGLKREWIQMKQEMMPVSVKVRRIDRRDFNCISPQYVYNVLERPTSQHTEFRCFNDPQGEGLNFCCDKQLNQCAQLKRELIPMEARAKLKAPKPAPRPKSDWVRAPSENDQWQTVDD